MYTTIRTSEGHIKLIITKPLILRSRVIVKYKNKTTERISDKSETRFHIDIRIIAIRRGDNIIDGDIIDYSGKYKINNFKNDNNIKS